MGTLIIRGRDIQLGHPYLITPQDTYPQRDQKRAQKELGTTSANRVTIVRKSNTR
jgi:hypothetical protein